MHFDLQQLPDFEENAEKYALILWDLETTGTSQQQIVQIGAWETFSNNIFESFVKPGILVSFVQNNSTDEPIDFNNGSVKHGIYNHHLTHKLGWKDIRKGLFSMGRLISRYMPIYFVYKIDKQILFVSHGKCDPRWLQNECKRVDLQVPSTWIFVDSIALARSLIGQNESVSLDALAKRYDVKR